MGIVSMLCLESIPEGRVNIEFINVLTTTGVIMQTKIKPQVGFRQLSGQLPLFLVDMNVNIPLACPKKPCGCYNVANITY